MLPYLLGKSSLKVEGNSNIGKAARHVSTSFHLSSQRLVWFSHGLGIAQKGNQIGVLGPDPWITPILELNIILLILFQH